MQPDFKAFFLRYVENFNSSLGGRTATEMIRACFAECFVGAGPAEVRCGRNDSAFAETLEKGFAFYREMGTRRMECREIEVTEIDPLHHLVRVFYRAGYEKEGRGIEIDFDVSYLLQTRDGVSKIFAFVSGDEMAEYRKHGLV